MVASLRESAGTPPTQSGVWCIRIYPQAPIHLTIVDFLGTDAKHFFIMPDLERSFVVFVAHYSGGEISDCAGREQVRHGLSRVIQPVRPCRDTRGGSLD